MKPQYINFEVMTFPELIQWTVWALKDGRNIPSEEHRDRRILAEWRNRSQQLQEFAELKGGEMRLSFSKGHFGGIEAAAKGVRP